MTLQLAVNQEYASLVPDISPQDYEAFKLDIKERGLLVPITVNSQGIILDGHHRFRACQELGIKCSYVIADFENELLEKLFVIDTNLKRRHLNSFQRAELALKEKPILEEIARRNESLGGKGVEISTPLGRVDKNIGKLAGVGKDNIRRVETILQKAPQELLDKARTAQWTINKIYRKLQNEEKRQDLINTKPIIELPDNIELVQGDFREQGSKIADNSIDLILTDPPYDEASLPLYRDLGIFANRVLKEGGSLVTIVGHYAMIKSAKLIEESGLKYIHYFPIIHSGASAILYAYYIRVKHKPMLYFVKGTKPNTPNIIDDVIYSTPPDKSLHEWAQSPVEAEHIIKGLTVGENQIVLDPFMGAGTFGRAALQLKRKFIGIEIDPQRFEIAKANLMLTK